MQLFFALLPAFFFLTLVFRHLFVGHLVVLARSEHRSAAGVTRKMRIASAFLARAETADAPDGFGDRASLDQKFTDLFKEIVQMIRLERVGKAFAFQDRLHFLGDGRRHQEERTNELRLQRTFCGWCNRFCFGKFLENGEQRPANVRERNVYDDEIPRSSGQFGESVRDQWNDADAPTLNRGRFSALAGWQRRRRL